jgi:hypothetical protein
MGSTQVTNEHATQAPSEGAVDMTREVVVIPVPDVDRAKRRYGISRCRAGRRFRFR